MGRKSVKKKKKKRRIQKHIKKQQKSLQFAKVTTPETGMNTSLSLLSIASDNQSISSFGSPGSPPPTPDSVPTLISSNNLDGTLGIDSDALTAKLNSSYNFEKSDIPGEILEGEELLLHLKESNLKLAAKVEYYRSQGEVARSELRASKNDCDNSVNDTFYRDLMHFIRS